MQQLRLYRQSSTPGTARFRIRLAAAIAAGGVFTAVVIAVLIFLTGEGELQPTKFLAVALVAVALGVTLAIILVLAVSEPMIAAADALRSYRQSRKLPVLPDNLADEAGTLMADVAATTHHLEKVRDTLGQADETTGLMNRKRFLQFLSPRSDRGDAYTIAIIRFANLVRIAQALSSEKAEAAVSIIADRLNPLVPPTGALARLGASELGVMLPSPYGEKRLREMVASCEAEIVLSGVTLRPDIYVGVARRPDDSSDPTELLDHALSANARAGPRMRTAYYSPAARTAAMERLQVEQELSNALERNEFELHYQPVVDVTDGVVSGAEALVRWRHPTRGLLMPNDFIPVAESCGLIEPMGLWVLNEACREVARWAKAGRPDLRVAVNLSASQFADRGLERKVGDALQAAGIPATQLEIELTETAAVADEHYTNRAFNMLRELGVSIAIDDFGTGYASISQLRRIPFDKLKIDREFVSQVYKRRDGQAICGALITLATGLGIDVVAEGTEDEHEVRYLKTRGCSLFQGFYFARPVDGDTYLRSFPGLTTAAQMVSRWQGALEAAPGARLAPQA